MLKKLILAGVATFALAAAANATVVVQYDVNGGGFVSCTDGAACDLNPGGNAVLVTIAGFGSVHITQGSASYPAGGPESIHLTVQNNEVPGPAVGTITIQVSADGFTTYDAPQSFVTNSSATALSFASVDYKSWADDGNTLFAQTCAIETGTTLTAPGFVATPGSCNTSGSYSLTQEMIINLNVGSTQEGAVNLIMSTEASVPEPMTTALLGMGLLGLAGLRLRRKA
jgi:hypothetical protein